MRIAIKSNKATLTLASLGAAMAMAFPMVSQADVMASAVVNVTNFLIKNNVTGATLDQSNFSLIDPRLTSGYLVDLNGVNQQGSSNAIPQDFATACVGTGCVANNTGMAPAGYGNDNSFTKLAAPVPGNYAAADQLDIGSGISGIPGLNTPASIGNASYAGLTTEFGLASSDSDNTLQAKFSLHADTQVRFDFDANAYLQAFMSDDEKLGGFATASYGMTLTIVDLDNNNAQVWSGTPDLFGNGNRTVSVNAPALSGGEAAIENTGGPTSFSAVVSNSAGPIVLLANRNYQLTARIETHADVQRVPEPGVLALIGMGLAGMSLARRRRPASA